MTVNNIYLPISGTFFGTSGTTTGNVETNRAVSLVLLCAVSGLTMIPIRCDSTGRIGSIA